MPRDYFPGMGQAVADRTVNRKGENWGDVAKRVALGSTLIADAQDRNAFESHIANASILMSGRHLQHGDATQPDRNLEIFSNCSTACQRSLVFYLLLNGSGVGSSYDDAICNVDFRNMPKVVCAIADDHGDVLFGRVAGYVTPAEAIDQARDAFRIFHVPDSREGWAYAIEEIETLAWEGRYRDTTLIIDFSGVRPFGSPIGGMQDRPASGPGPLMEAIKRVTLVREKAWKPWRQALQIDHELAECVLVGGARRSARIAVKNWRDPDILEFINCKQEGGLWTANNSVGVDAEFWAEKPPILFSILHAQYTHGTGEPGLLNLDQLAEGEGRPTVEQAMELGGKYKLGKKGQALRRELIGLAHQMRYPYIVNPCGEIRLHVLGAYCTIADVVPFHAASDEDAAEAFALATRALLRTNTLPALYQGEVRRTNRIGVGFTGIHEYAWSRFGLGFRDLLDEDVSFEFWGMLRYFADVVTEAASDWCREHKAEMPVTLRTVKPAGTTSKLFGLTEGVHLPALREYLRWVQFRSDDPLVAEYIRQGYPSRELKTYSGTTVIGFPTQPTICQMGMEVVTAPEATPAEQFRWLQLLEKYWLGASGGNQISYTLKYDPKAVAQEEYFDIMIAQMPKVRAVSVMPAGDMSVYEYQPEEPITPTQYHALVRGTMKEDVGIEHVDCAGGACPIDFRGETADAAPPEESPAAVLLDRHDAGYPVDFSYLLYTMPDCSHCVRASAELDIRGISYMTVRVDDLADRRDLAKSEGWTTFPMIYHRKSALDDSHRFVGGADDLIRELRAA